MIIGFIRRVRGFIGFQMCKRFRKHKFIVVREPSNMFPKDQREPVFFNKDGLRYYEHCKRLEMFDYHCLGLNPPQYIVDNSKKIDYYGLVGTLVEDPYNLLPVDLQLIK